MNKLALAMALVFSTFPLFAEDTVRCSARANPDRGFAMPFKVALLPAIPGGAITLEMSGRTQVIGTIETIQNLKRSSPSDKAAFDATLAFIGAEDVSGIASEELPSVSVIKTFMGKASDKEEEIALFQLMSDVKQIGGTFLISGMATACTSQH